MYFNICASKKKTIMVRVPTILIFRAGLEDAGVPQKA
jgi:hypothetical protein